EPALVLLELVARVHDLEEGSPDHHALLAQDLELALEPVGHPGCPPAELDDVDVRAVCLEHVRPGAGAEPLVEDVREPAVALDPEVEAVVRAGHRAPSASRAPPPARRGTGSCRARRSRPSAARSP